MGEDLRRRIVLLQKAAIHHGHLVGHGDGLELVVRHVDDRGLQVLVEALDLGAHLHAQLGVEVGERLVHQEDRGVAHQRAAESHTLLLAARELARLALEQVRHVEHLRRFPDLPVDLVPRQLAHLQREGEVLVDRLLRIERVVLEHHRDVAVLRVEVVDHAVPDGDVAGGDRDSPATRLSVVVLPQPGGPTSATNSPSLTVSDTSLTALNGAIGLDEIFKDHMGHDNLPSNV